MERIFPCVFADGEPESSCFSCDASCVCEVCDGDSQCNWG